MLSGWTAGGPAAKTLQDLEGDGLVIRTDHRLVPPKVEYRLSPLGMGAAEELRRLADWIEINLVAIASHWPEDKQTILCGAREELGAAPSKG
jgi:DNA-binding HxlR family transcriptional regulator